MARSRLSIHKFPGSCLFEALGGSASSLHLWHNSLSFILKQYPIFPVRTLFGLLTTIILQANHSNKICYLVDGSGQKLKNLLSSRASSQSLINNPNRVLGQSFLGASIVYITGPCLTGTFSETAISDISSTIRFNKANPNSG
jgi:hypothetical protein